VLPVKVKAEPNPRGGRIDISWTNPRESAFEGVKIVRRVASYPDARAIEREAGVFDQKLKAGEEVLYSDGRLKGETVYYYAVAAYDTSDPPKYFPVFVSSMSTTDYGTAQKLFESLPSLYRRADTLPPPPNLSHIAPEDKSKGQLRRLLDMFGMEFDVLRSYAGGMRDFHDVDRVDGQLLPLLAQWIGWQTDFSLPLTNQRNEIKYAPHFYRTNGIAANLRAMLNRLTTWDAQVKEFVHNVMLTNNPERLNLWQRHRHRGGWEAEKLISPHVAYEGRPSVVHDDNDHQWIFYHASEDAQQSQASEDAQQSGDDGTSASTREVFHVWYKHCRFGEWLPARRVTLLNGINKYPSAVRRRGDESFFVFYNSVTQSADGASPSKIRLSLLSAGHTAQPARLFGKKKEPFTLSAGESLSVAVGDGESLFTRTVIFYEEDFRTLKEATAEEVAAFLNREIPGVRVAVGDDKSILLTTISENQGASLTASGAAARSLGLEGQGAGADASTARVAGGAVESFALKAGATLTIKIDNDAPRVIVFAGENFGDISHARASEVAEVVNRELPGSAEAFKDGDETKLRISSPTVGAGSSIVIDVDASSAAPALGFGAPLPPAETPAADAEPAALTDTEGNVWLFWSSLRAAEQGWSIWYNRLSYANGEWGTARQLTAGRVADKQPAVLFDASPGGRVWVFWSGRREVASVERDGRAIMKLCWNIFYRSAPNSINFDALKASDWTERELNATGASAYDNQEPAACLLYSDGKIDPARVELYFTSNRDDGLNVWSNIISTDAQGDDAQVTRGQFTQRAPAVAASPEKLTLWYRSNATQVYSSSVYPAAKTYDARHSGSTTIDTRNPAKMSFSLRRSIDDITHYTYDTARKATNWYSRDTVGVYLTPDTTDEALIFRKQNQIENLLRSVLPIQVRPVLVIQEVFPEKIYTYDYPNDAPQARIREHAFDALLHEIYRGLTEESFDRVNFRWMRTWERGRPDYTMPDTRSGEHEISSRLFLPNVEEEGGDA
jgi:phage tail-like protein